MTIQEAIICLRAGRLVRRRAWADVGGALALLPGAEELYLLTYPPTWVTTMQVKVPPDSAPQVQTEPLKRGTPKSCLWVPYPESLLADDWEVYNPETDEVEVPVRKLVPGAVLWWSW